MFRDKLLDKSVSLLDDILAKIEAINQPLRKMKAEERKMKGKFCGYYGMPVWSGDEPCDFCLRHPESGNWEGDLDLNDYSQDRKCPCFGES